MRRGADDGRAGPARRRLPVFARLVALTACGLLLSGCGLLGKPRPLSADAPLDMSVTGPEFTGHVIPSRFTCDGAGQSPPVSWSGAPAGTKSLALVVDDSGAPISPRVYWIVFDIGADTTDLQIGPAAPGASAKAAPSTLPPGARVAYNSAGTVGYDPPCPRTAPHKYRFTIYALNTYFGSSLPDNARLLQAWTLIASHVIGRGTMTAEAVPAHAGS